MRIATVCILALASLSSCAFFTPEKQPPETENFCDVITHRPGWLRILRITRDRWGVQPWVTAAFIHQESRFDPHAVPKGGKIDGSNAYGYAQAIKTTWDLYRKDVNKPGAKRDVFADAADFIGWFNSQSNKRFRISLQDARRLYLVYHEGPTNYQNKSYKQASNKWIVRVAKKVARRAEKYRAQYQLCSSF